MFGLSIFLVSLLMCGVVSSQASRIDDDIIDNLIAGPKSVKINKQQEMSVLQDQISKCFPQLKNLKKIDSFKNLYASLDRQFFLLNEITNAAEVIYKANDEIYKLKVSQNKITWFRIDEDGTAQPKSIDAKHKLTTVRGKIKQMTLNTRIQEEWADYTEKRENGLVIEYSVRAGEITKLRAIISKDKQELSCEKKSASEVCFCSKIRS